MSSYWIRQMGEEIGRKKEKERYVRRWVEMVRGEPRMRQRETRPYFLSAHGLCSTLRLTPGNNSTPRKQTLPFFFFFPLKHNDSFRKQANKQTKARKKLFCLLCHRKQVNLGSADMVFWVHLEQPATPTFGEKMPKNYSKCKLLC